MQMHGGGAHPTGVAARGAQNRDGGLHQRHAERQDQRHMAEFSDHAPGTLLDVLMRDELTGALYRCMGKQPRPPRQQFSWRTVDERAVMLGLDPRIALSPYSPTSSHSSVMHAVADARVEP